MRKISYDSEKPALGMQVFTACAFIHHDFDGVDKLFLPKRASTRKFLPNVYELPGGHIDFGEDMKTGLAREIDEEFGMHISIGDPFFVFTYTNEIKGSHSIEVIYFATFTKDMSRIHFNPEYHSEYVWVAEQELPSIYGAGKNEDDPEIQAMKKGFAILHGERLLVE